VTAALPPAGSRILVVDDDDRLGPRLVRALCERGYEAVHAADGAAAVAAVDHAPFDHAVVDLRIGHDSGLDVLRLLLARQPDLEAIMLTGYGSIATAVDAMRLGAVNYLQKPADVDMVLAALARGAAEPLETAPAYEPPTLARTEWEHICRVLDDCGGNVSKAARLLGMHRRTLQRKLQSFPPRR
jgi:two-component system response regulator RegA